MEQLLERAAVVWCAGDSGAQAGLQENASLGPQPQRSDCVLDLRCQSRGVSTVALGQDDDELVTAGSDAQAALSNHASEADSHVT